MSLSLCARVETSKAVPANEWRWLVVTESSPENSFQESSEAPIKLQNASDPYNTLVALPVAFATLPHEFCFTCSPHLADRRGLARRVGYAVAAGARIPRLPRWLLLPDARDAAPLPLPGRMRARARRRNDGRNGARPGFCLGCQHVCGLHRGAASGKSMGARSQPSACVPAARLTRNPRRASKTQPKHAQPGWHWHYRDF